VTVVLGFRRGCDLPQEWHVQMGRTATIEFFANRAPFGLLGDRVCLMVASVFDSVHGGTLMRPPSQTPVGSEAVGFS
jgi:hypothetical protein